MEIMTLGAISGIVWCGLCVLSAHHKRRNEVAWGVAGFLFGALALLVLVCLRTKCPSPVPMGQVRPTSNIHPP